MRTYRAMLAKWRMEELHEDFIERARKDAERRIQPGPRRHAFETMCPYCAVEDELYGTIRIGAKDQESEVPMTDEGFEDELPETGERDTEILIIRCGECGAAVDPIAYLSPSVFVRNHSDIELFEEVA